METQNGVWQWTDPCDDIEQMHWSVPQVGGRKLERKQEDTLLVLHYNIRVIHYNHYKKKNNSVKAPISVIRWTEQQECMMI